MVTDRAGYSLQGTVLEVGDAAGSLAAWCIRNGHINDVDVSGQVVLIVLSGMGDAPARPTRRLVLIEERATPEQTLAMLDVFRGPPERPSGRDRSTRHRGDRLCAGPHQLLA